MNSPQKQTPPLLIQTISAFRPEIMGLAILWVVFYHCDIDIAMSAWPLRVLKMTGYGGVDIFFFLSGFGLFYGWISRPASLPDFYRRRFVRIFPAYLLVVTAYHLLAALGRQKTSFIDFLSMATGLNFFLNRKDPTLLWFIPAIALCYLAFPVIFKLLVKNGAKDAGFGRPLLAMALGVALSLAITPTDYNYLLIFTARLPVFFCGIYAAHLSRCNSREPVWISNIWLNVSSGSWADYSSHQLSFLHLLPP